MKRSNTYAGLGGVKSTPITGTAQTLSPTGRGLFITGAGQIVGKLLEDETDRTFSGLLVGAEYSMCFKSITSATATGFVLH